MNWVWTCSRSHSGTRLVLLAIADCASGDGTNAWPSIAELKRKTGMGERTIHSAITSLVTLGELEVEYKAGPGGCNRYTIIMSEPDTVPIRQGIDAEEHPADSARCKNRTVPIRQGTLPIRQGHPAESAPGTVLEPKNLRKPPTGVSAQVILSDFIDWVRANDGELTKRTIGMLAKQIGDLIAQGVPDRFIRHGLAAWHARDQHPSTLDSFVNSALNAAARSNTAPPPVSRRQQETDALFAAAMERAKAKEANL